MGLPPWFVSHEPFLPMAVGIRHGAWLAPLLSNTVLFFISAARSSFYRCDLFSFAKVVGKANCHNLCFSPLTEVNINIAILGFSLILLCPENITCRQADCSLALQDL